MADTASATIERREYKYLVHPSRIPGIRRALQGWCVLDRHAQSNRLYAIRSLYLDTGDLRLAKANAAEVHTRFKVRVREYPGTTAPVFLEIKRRYGDVIKKLRTQIQPAAWPGLLNQPLGELSEGVAGFVDLVQHMDLRPVTLVEYDREAYMSEVDDYARVTFDLAIGCQRADDWTLHPYQYARLPIDNPVNTSTVEPRVVIELKFAGPAPMWMRHIVERFELERQSFSKYVSSVEALAGMGDLGTRGVGA